MEGKERGAKVSSDFPFTRSPFLLLPRDSLLEGEHRARLQHIIHLVRAIWMRSTTSLIERICVRLVTAAPAEADGRARVGRGRQLLPNRHTTRPLPVQRPSQILHIEMARVGRIEKVRSIYT